MCFRHMTPQDLARQQAWTVVIDLGANRFKLTVHGTWYNVAIGHLSHEELSEHSSLMLLHNPVSEVLLEQWEGFCLDGIVSHQNLQWVSDKLRQLGLDFNELMSFSEGFPTLTAQQTNKFVRSHAGMVLVAVDVDADIAPDSGLVYCWYNEDWHNQYGPAELRADGRYVTFVIKHTSRAFKNYTPEQLEQVMEDYIDNQYL